MFTFASNCSLSQGFHSRIGVTLGFTATVLDTVLEPPRDIDWTKKDKTGNVCVVNVNSFSAKFQSIFVVCSVLF